MVNSSTYGAKMPRANSDFINNIYVQIPPLRAAIHRQLPRPEMQRDRRTNFHQATEDRETERLQKIIDFRVCNREKKGKLGIVI